jgi:spindle assembly abnormal protein 6
MKLHTSTSSISKGYTETRVYEIFEPEEINVPVRIRSVDREEKYAVLRIAVSMNNLSGTHHQALVIEVTDETDPFFLYALECGEAEFHAIKQEQTILVDFLTFPHKLIELLQFCTKKLEDNPKFICTLDKGHGFEGTLNICENNFFRQITHLSLKLRSGSDEIIKKHLAGKLKEYKSHCETLEVKLSQTEESLQLRNAEYYDSVKQFEILNSEFERKLEESKLLWQEKMNSLKQQMLEAQHKLSTQFDQEKRYLVEKYEKNLDEVSNKLEITQAKLNETSAGKYAAETRERELSLKLSQIEHELEISNNELHHLRKTNKNLDTSKFDQEKALTEYKLKLQNVERQLQDKDELNQKLSALLQTNSEFKGHQDDTMSMLKATVSKLEDKLQQSVNEINKGNSIIQKLQSDLKAGKQKLKLKNTVVLQQENVIQQKHELIDANEKQLYQFKRELDKKDENIRDLERLITDLKNKLEDNQKALDSNVQTIQYLNNRINEVEKVRIPYTSTYKPATNPSPIAFRPSTYSLEHLKTTPRTSSYSSIPEADPFPKLLEPIKYKEPNNS